MRNQSASTLDYTSATASMPGAPGRVDVIVPVHGAAPEFEACLRSVVQHTDLREHGLIVVFDGADQDGAKDTLQRHCDGTSVKVIENARCEGYVRSVNMAMHASLHDVVLLNSDTVVSAGWIEQMRSAAYSSPGIATATPLTNRGAHCSIPCPLSHDSATEAEIAAAAELVRHCSQHAYPRIPSGVGFCHLIKRAALDQLGFYDEAFAPGYGEEADFCLRALKAGYVHVADDATFVYHRGGRSFGAAARELRRAGMVKLRERHAEFIPTMAAFLRADPLNEVRAKVAAAFAEQRGQLPERT
jgi:GT2 family glycosyltransferase